MDIGKILGRQAKKHGICEEWLANLASTNDLDRLFTMYITGIDFCLVNDYPSNDFIREHFKGKMEGYGIHLDEEFQAFNERKVVALGCCKAHVAVDDYTTCEVFAKHSSELSIRAKGNSFVMIDLFDDAVLKIRAGDESKVCVNRYGGVVIFTSDDKSVVKIVEKQRKTY